MNKKKGQIAVIIALSMTFLFLLFAMVTNITYLVAAKINLQNAVDLAAYAGAAQQARYLTEIGKWNYEMRRNYKAFVYDYVINFNSEKRTEFKDKYLKNYDNPRPAVALTLPRRINNTSKEISSLFLNTSFSVPGIAGADAIELAKKAADKMVQSGIPILKNLGETIQEVTGALAGQRDFYKNLSNNYANHMHNYNSRLLNWTVFDYRNIQARIRGVNFTGLDFNKTENRLLSNSTDSPGQSIFKNAPISVGAKVINSYLGEEEEAKFINNILEINENTASNPMHNASYHTYKKNLLNVFDEYKLFYLKPKEPGPLGNNPMGDNACNEQCTEFRGPNLKLDSHDGSFLGNFISLFLDGTKYKSADIFQAMEYYENLTSNKKVYPFIIDKFPIGVAKDTRIKTYYTVIGIANTNNIPFNVFFGQDEESYNMPLIAVASAMPYGSRIGPFIDETCNSFSNPNSVNCKANGLDPRYPPDIKIELNNTNNNELSYLIENHLYPDFTTNNINNNSIRLVNAGVKGTVIDKELLMELNFSNNFLRLFTMGYAKEARYRAPRDLILDDGFCNTHNANCNLTTNANSPPYIELAKIHPQHHRNSIIAWNSNPNINPPSNNFDDYLYSLKGKAIHAFDKRADNFRVYTFKYPKLGNKYWNIGSLVQENSPTAQNSMEFSFANSMAVSEFEIYRYIIPNKNNSNSDILNWHDNANNNVFKGLKNYDKRDQIDNITVFDNLIKSEDNDVLQTSNNNTMESYTAWRTGIRGYKVKLTNIKELLSSNGDFENTLETSYTITGFDDEEIVIDLNKIAY